MKFQVTSYRKATAQIVAITSNAYGLRDARQIANHLATGTETGLVHIVTQR